MEWKKLFTYDPTSPTFLVNNKTRSPKAIEGKPAGCVGAKEIKTRYNGKFYRNARIVWELHHGTIKGDKLIKFKDGNEFNLLIDNLSIQSRREKGVQSNQPLGHSGERGVWPSKSGGWVAAAKVEGKNVYLGTFNEIKEAIRARRLALKLVKL